MAKIQCPKCMRTMDEDQFYTYRDKTKTELCKKCLTMHIDNFNPDTFLWLLEKMDMPYIEAEWNVLRDRAYARDPKGMNGMSVFGKYLSKMRINQWKDYRWTDSDTLNAQKAEKDAAKAEIERELAEENKRRFEAGEISEAEYKTLTSTKEQVKSGLDLTAAAQTPYLGANNAFNEADFISEEDLNDPSDLLSNEEKVYLSMKWGRLYKAREWVELEKMYVEMKECFEVSDPDTKNTLVLLCKTTLKANQAIDCGDIEGFQKLSKVAENLRKSAKFTAAQNKEGKQDVVDCLGNLIIMCEREGGFIPRFATDIPQDKVDITMRDQNMFLQRLVKEDLGFGQQIEDAVKRILIQNELDKQAEEIKENDPNADLFGMESADEDVIDFFNEIADQQELEDGDY